MTIKKNTHATDFIFSWETAQLLICKTFENKIRNRLHTFKNISMFTSRVDKYNINTIS